jgi:site-specific recombinase XerD
MLLNDLKIKYLLYCYTKSERTRFIYSQHITRLLTYLNDPPIETITEENIIEFMAGLRRKTGQSYSPGYQSQIYRSLNTFFGWAKQRGYITTNPMAEVPKPRPNHNTAKRLTDDQITKLLEAVEQTTPTQRNRDRAIIMLMLDSGLRLNEVVTLLVENIDLINRRARVYSAKTSKWRDVPLGASTVEILSECMGRRQSGPVFFTKSRQPLTIDTVSKLFCRLKKKCGFPLHAHLLRHTFGRIYNRRGDIRKLQIIMGHSDVSTTARFYTDPDFDDIQAEHQTASPMAQREKKKF